MPDAAGAAARHRPGRPSTGARERILEAALEVLKQDGYAGLTTAKVAARSGQNKALISYHFGSKQGLVAEVARAMSEAITEELLAGIGRPATCHEVVRGVMDGLDRISDRDEGLARLYFDLASQSVVEPEVRDIVAEQKAGYRRVLCDLLLGVGDGPARRDAAAAATYLIAAFEGFMLERLDRGDTPELRRARAMFLRTAPAALRATR